MNLENIKKVDPIVAEQIELELKRQQETIELIASENITSLAAIVANCVQYSNMTEEQKTSLRTELDLVYLEEV